MMLTVDSVGFQTSMNVLTGHVTSTRCVSTPSQAMCVCVRQATRAMVTRVSVRHPYYMHIISL